MNWSEVARRHICGGNAGQTVKAIDVSRSSANPPGIQMRSCIRKFVGNEVSIPATTSTSGKTADWTTVVYGLWGKSCEVCGSYSA